MEKLRLSAWKKSPVSAENDKDMKDGPKMVPKSLSAVTKGVKFAVSICFYALLLVIFMFYGKLIELHSSCDWVKFKDYNNMTIISKLD